MTPKRAVRELEKAVVKAAVEWARYWPKKLDSYPACNEYSRRGDRLASAVAKLKGEKHGK